MAGLAEPRQPKQIVLLANRPAVRGSLIDLRRLIQVSLR